MKTPFFITGLPRSRTAWLANFFTTDGTLCFHDPRESVSEIIDRHPTLRVGVADATLPLKYPGLVSKYPDAPWLYVFRPEVEARQSFIKFISGHVSLTRRGVDSFFRLHREATARMIEKGNGRVWTLQFAQLNEPAAVESAWKHLLPEVAWNPLRWAVLNNLQVEQRLKNRVKELESWNK